MKSIVTDIKEAVDHYQTNGLGNAGAWSICLQQLEAIVPHQYGDHSKCQHERWCTYLKVKRMHPIWTANKIA